jgi:predicted DNA-binding transcriptional regulator YafY
LLLAPGFRLFEYRLIIKREWVNLLLSFGADLVVLEPQSLRSTLRNELAASVSNYPV